LFDDVTLCTSLFCSCERKHKFERVLPTLWLIQWNDGLHFISSPGKLVAWSFRDCLWAERFQDVFRWFDEVQIDVSLECGEIVCTFVLQLSWKSRRIDQDMFYRRSTWSIRTIAYVFADKVILWADIASFTYQKPFGKTGTLDIWAISNLLWNSFTKLDMLVISVPYLWCFIHNGSNTIYTSSISEEGDFRIPEYFRLNEWLNLEVWYHG
jgi:hypothetical protein